MRKPDYVSSDSIVTAAQWSALSEYMRWAYLSLPQTVALTATYAGTAYSATSSFTTGTTIYNRSSGTANVVYIPVMSRSSGNSSGFYSRGQGVGQTSADNIPAPLVTSGSIGMPTSTAYFSGSWQCACSMAIEGDWMEEA